MHEEKQQKLGSALRAGIMMILDSYAATSNINNTTSHTSTPTPTLTSTPRTSTPISTPTTPPSFQERREPLASSFTNKLNPTVDYHRHANSFFAYSNKNNIDDSSRQKQIVITTTTTQAILTSTSTPPASTTTTPSTTTSPSTTTNTVQQYIGNNHLHQHHHQQDNHRQNSLSATRTEKTERSGNVNSNSRNNTIPTTQHSSSFPSLSVQIINNSSSNKTGGSGHGQGIVNPRQRHHQSDNPLSSSLKKQLSGGGEHHHNYKQANLGFCDHDEDDQFPFHYNNNNNSRISSAAGKETEDLTLLWTTKNKSQQQQQRQRRLPPNISLIPSSLNQLISSEGAVAVEKEEEDQEISRSSFHMSGGLSVGLVEKRRISHPATSSTPSSSTSSTFDDYFHQHLIHNNNNNNNQHSSDDDDGCLGGSSSSSGNTPITILSSLNNSSDLNSTSSPKSLATTKSNNGNNFSFASSQQQTVANLSQQLEGIKEEHLGSCSDDGLRMDSNKAIANQPSFFSSLPFSTHSRHGPNQFVKLEPSSPEEDCSRTTDSGHGLFSGDGDESPFDNPFSSSTNNKHNHGTSSTVHNSSLFGSPLEQNGDRIGDGSHGGTGVAGDSSLDIYRDLILRHLVTDITSTCAKLSIPSDPNEWSPDQTVIWLQEMTTQFHLVDHSTPFNQLYLPAAEYSRTAGGDTNSNGTNNNNNNNNMTGGQEQEAQEHQNNQTCNPLLISSTNNNNNNNNSKLCHYDNNNDINEMDVPLSMVTTNTNNNGLTHFPHQTSSFTGGFGYRNNNNNIINNNKQQRNNIDNNNVIIGTDPASQWNTATDFLQNWDPNLDDDDGDEESDNNNASNNNNNNDYLTVQTGIGMGASSSTSRLNHQSSFSTPLHHPLLSPSDSDSGISADNDEIGQHLLNHPVHPNTITNNFIPQQHQQQQQQQHHQHQHQNLQNRLNLSNNPHQQQQLQSDHQQQQQQQLSQHHQHLQQQLAAYAGCGQQLQQQLSNSSNNSNSTPTTHPTHFNFSHYAQQQTSQQHGVGMQQMSQQMSNNNGGGMCSLIPNTNIMNGNGNNLGIAGARHSNNNGKGNSGNGRGGNSGGNVGGRTHHSTGSIHLWQFIRELLDHPDKYSQCVRWVDRTEGIFKIEDSHKLARLWGQRKNRHKMNYDKLSRSLRQYYKKNIIKKTGQRQRLIYQFIPPYHIL